MNRRSFLFSTGGAIALALPPCLHAQEIVKAEAVSGDRFVADGVEYHLTDILAPSAYDLHRNAHPYFIKSKQALAAELKRSSLAIKATGETNRWGAQRVTAYTAGGATLQQKLVAIGAARVAPYTDDAEFIEGLYRLEQEARSAKRGLWALEEYRIHEAADAWPAIGGYHLIEGEAQSAAARKGRFYVNFGEDFREDFTITTRSRNYRKWLKSGLDLADVAGKRLRVRGFVLLINGPSIEMDHLQQIEILA